MEFKSMISELASPRPKDMDMLELMNDFRSILQDERLKLTGYSLSVNPSSDDYVKSNKTSTMVDIILKRASYSGYIQHFVEIYIRERKNIMQSRFIQFNIDKWSTYEIKKLEWALLESLIKIWIKSVKTSLMYLFVSEKKLCEEIFQGLVRDIEDIFYEVIIQDYQIQVFNIIYALSFSNPPIDKLFVILDLYETLDHFLNEMCFFENPREPFQAAVHTPLFSVLSDKIINSLSLFEMALLYYESSVIFVGPVDPLPRYVMSYLLQLCDHVHTLNSKKLSLPKLPSIDEVDPSLYIEEFEGQGKLSSHVIWIIMMVVTNLEGKAKLCEDGSAGHFFAMKNIHHIVHEIEGHQGLMRVVGDDYLDKLIEKLDNAKANYLTLELQKIIQMRD